MRRQPTIARRSFLKGIGLAAGALGFPAIIPASARGADGAVPPSNRVALGFIGLGEHGREVNLNTFSLYPEVQVVALCDVDAERLQHAHLLLQVLGASSAESVNAFEGCLVTGDWREVVARDDLDAVVISTPDHWHVIPAVAAVRAGKDVFCEKPLSLTVHEGRVLSDTVRRYGACFQTGLEDRSLREFVRACRLVRTGAIGTLHTIHVEMFRGFGLGGAEMEAAGAGWSPEPVPSGFDYDMWLGQAPEAPYTRLRCHNSFRYILDYSGGNLTDWGSHLFDIAQWGNNTDHTGPVSVEGWGVFPKSGLFNAATDWDLTFEYANGVTLVCRSGGFSIRFEGTDGWVQSDSKTLRASSPQVLHALVRPQDTHLHTCARGEHRDFLNGIRTRGATLVPAEAGHRSMTLAHIGNIAMILGRKLQWDPARERFVSDDAANGMLSRSMRAPWRLDA